MKTKITKKQALEIISGELRKGIVDAPKILEIIGKKWNISKSSFYNYFKIAVAAFKEEQLKITKQVEKKIVDAESKRAKKDILTKHERMEIATAIARGSMRVAGDEEVYPSDADRLRALDYLSKLDGDYAAIKVEEKVTFSKSVKVRYTQDG